MRFRWRRGGGERAGALCSDLWGNVSGLQPLEFAGDVGSIGVTRGYYVAAPSVLTFKSSPLARDRRPELASYFAAHEDEFIGENARLK